MRYEFINPESLPEPENMSSDKEYTTRIVSATFDVIQLEYIGEEVPKNSHTCLLPVIKTEDN